MSDKFDSNSGKDLEDIDFEEFLTENGEFASKPRPKKPAESTARLLFSAIGESVGGDADGVDDKAASAKVDNEGADKDRTGSGIVGADSVSVDENSDSRGSDRLGSGTLADEKQGRIVEKMAWSTKQNLIVAFQGEAGAYSEQALRLYFGSDATPQPCADFAGIFDAIHSGQAQRGILPVENSLAGTVSAAYDQLADHDLRIQGEVILRVEHCLMAPAGLRMRDIKRVKSHPQALAQCQQTLRRLGIEAVIHYDTAGAARDLAKRPEPGTAAIASALAAKTYGLEVLARHFEDETLNYTRFFILGLSDPPRKDPSKTSVIFTTRHNPGALHRVLSELAERNINLTKIESRPRRNRPWHYLFYMDFEGHEDQPETREALLGILKQASFLKVLGSYPAAPMPVGDQNQSFDS